ncbi:MAG TPA: SRPBCC domain-containing protein [Thermoanaerobaculia bacterium]|nr:SRPBCC domain-containing protein [Thermoanaerobaculia bacterium]
MLRIIAIATLIATPLFADSAKRIERELVVSAPPPEVWRAWTTTEGIKSFFAPDAKVELTRGGAYEMYFDPSQPPGFRGGETNRVIDFDPERMLLFSWNAPPRFGPLRAEHTWVLIRFDDAPGGGTCLHFTHFGWRGGEQWDALYDYFDKAWTGVLGNFRNRYDR